MRIKSTGKKYPKKVYIIKFEDLVNNPYKMSKKIAKILNIRYSKSMKTTTLLGKQRNGNSTIRKTVKVKGSIYKSSVNRLLKNVIMPDEYKKIIAYINKVAI